MHCKYLLFLQILNFISSVDYFFLPYNKLMSYGLHDTFIWKKLHLSCGVVRILQFNYTL